MLKNQILDALREMPNVERLEISQFALRLVLVLEDMDKKEKLSLKDAAEIMRPYYEEGSELTEFVDTCDEEFYEYSDYA